MADLTGGQLVARTLRGAGVRHVFTLCGGHILPIFDGCLTEDVGIIDVRHEQAAAHAGDAYARLTRGVGVAIVVPGPGVTDAVTGVANAYAARSPLLLIGGAAPLGLRGLGALQETEQVALLKPITKGAWSVAETRQIPEVLATAIRTALAGRPGPVFVEIPVDLLLTTVEERLAPIPTGYVHRTRGAADADALAGLEALVGGAERPVVIAGGGVYWDDAAKSLATFAERSGVPVFMNGAGRGALATDHPNAFFQTRGWALGHADVVLVLGTPLDFRLGYGRPPTFAEGAKVAMIDVDPVELGRNRPLELGLAGDLDVILRQLTDALPKGLAGRVAPWGTELRRREGEARAKLEELAATDQVPVSHVAKLLRPDQRVLLVSGDGAFGLNGMELETAVRFGLPFTCIIGNDGGWGQIRSPQVSFFGEARTVATSLPTTRYDRMVEALGGRGAFITDPREIGPALTRALASDEVWCLNVVLDPEAYRKSGQVSMAI